MQTNTAKKSHRDRRNGAAHEAWQKRKATANAARGGQRTTVQQQRHINSCNVGTHKREWA